MATSSTAGPVADPITVVIATRDRPALLEAAVTAVNGALRHGDGVIVVDSASRSPEVRRVAAALGAEVVRCDRAGASLARNTGWRAAPTDLVAFTDDDCLPEPGWLATLAAAFAAVPSAAFVTGSVRSAGQPPGRGQIEVSLHEEEEPATFGASSDPTAPGHGANMAWRRGVLEELGGLDEALGPGTGLRGAEDVDLFWRALRAGHRGYYEPAAAVRHRHWRTRRQQVRAYYGYGVGSGALAVKQARAGTAEGGRAAGALGALWAARSVLWERGLRAVGSNVAHGYEMAAAVEAAKLAGMVGGVLRARSLPITGGRFVARP